MISDPQPMAECLMQAFSSVYVGDTPQHPATQQFTGNLNNIDFSSIDVLNLLLSLDTNSSMGPDGIHPLLLRECAKNLAYPLYLIFTKSLQTSTVPLAWKQSLIIPIFKKGTRQDPLNYRPISLTSICCKILE